MPVRSKPKPFSRHDHLTRGYYSRDERQLALPLRQPTLWDSLFAYNIEDFQDSYWRTVRYSNRPPLRALPVDVLPRYDRPRLHLTRTQANGPIGRAIRGGAAGEHIEVMVHGDIHAGMAGGNGGAGVAGCMAGGDAARVAMDFGAGPARTAVQVAQARDQQRAEARERVRAHFMRMNQPAAAAQIMEEANGRD